jgi:hypothetical protein
MFMDVIHVHVERQENMVKSGAWIVHESWCCAKPPPTLNRWPQEGQGMWGHKGEDYKIDITKTPSGCGEWGEKKANGPKEDEGIGQSKLKGMGMMVKWMETRTQLGIKVKLITGFPLGVC